jgi:hypothetical protein
MGAHNGSNSLLVKGVGVPSLTTVLAANGKRVQINGMKIFQDVSNAFGRDINIQSRHTIGSFNFLRHPV